MNSQSIVCDVGTRESDEIHFVQGEKGRVLEFSFINTLLGGGIVPLAGRTVTIHLLKSDGNFTIDTLNIDSLSNTAFYTLTENDCIVGGCGVYDLSISDNNIIIYTAHGKFTGDYRAISDDTVNSVSSAYGVIFPEGFQEKLVAGDNITINGNMISADVIEYVAGDNIRIEGNVISAEVPSAYTTRTLWNDTPVNLVGSEQTFTLADSFANYDELVFYYYTTALGTPLYYSRVVKKECINNSRLFVISDTFVYSNAGAFTYGSISGNTLTTHLWQYQGVTDIMLEKIVGVKY